MNQRFTITGVRAALLVGVFLGGAAASWAQVAATYTVTASSTVLPARAGATGVHNGGAAGGNILVGTTVIGTWSVSGWNATELGGRAFDGFSVVPFQATTGNYRDTNGIGLSMLYPSSKGPGGATNFGYSVQASITAGQPYVVQGVTILGGLPGSGYFQGPNSAAGSPPVSTPWPAPNPNPVSLGSLNFSNFGGTATLTNPTTSVAGRRNLNTTNTTTKSTSPWTIANAYNQGDGGAVNPSDWTVDNTFWKLSTDAGNTMTFATDYGGRGAANEASAFSFTIVGIPDMRAELLNFPTTPVAPGGTVTGQLVCTNIGAAMANNPTCAVSGLPAGATVACPSPTPTTLAVGEAITCNVTYTQPAGPGVTMTGSTGIDNTATDLLPGNNTATLLVPTPADMATTLTGFPSGAAAGQTVTGTLTCTNVGGQPATSPTCVIAGLPAGVTPVCVKSPDQEPLPAGGTITCTATYAQPASGSTVTGTTGAANDTNSANNVAQQSVGLPAPVPTLNQYVQMLLGALLMLTAAGALRARRTGRR